AVVLMLWLAAFLQVARVMFTAGRLRHVLVGHARPCTLRFAHRPCTSQSGHGAGHHFVVHATTECKESTITGRCRAGGCGPITILREIYHALLPRAYNVADVGTTARERTRFGLIAVT